MSDTQKTNPEVEQKDSNLTENLGMEYVPKKDRTHWINPALIYAGCMICVPVIYVGASLASMYKFSVVLLTIAIASVIVLIYDWINATLGQQVGRPAAAIARCAFGHLQSRILVSGLLIYMCLGWYGIHVGVAAKAALMLFGVDYASMSSPWALYLAMAVLGMLFATPAIIGYKWLNWISRIGLPLIIVVGIYGTIKAVNAYGGWGNILTFNPQGDFPLSIGIISMIGCCAAQFVMISDYTRYCRKPMPDSMLVPLVGVIPAGLFLYLMGAIMSSGTGSADIVYILGVELGVGWWAFFFLLFAQWTTEIVSAYSAGLGIVNMFNLKGHKRGLVTLVGAAIGTLAAILGIADSMEGFLYTLAISYPAVGIIMAVDFFALRDRKWSDIPGVNWMALIATAIACVVGGVVTRGYASLTSIAVASICYYVLMVIQGKVHPNKFTPEAIKNGTWHFSFSDPLISFGLIGVLVACLVPIIWTNTVGEIGAVAGTLLVGLGFFLKLRQYKKQDAVENAVKVEVE